MADFTDLQVQKAIEAFAKVATERAPKPRGRRSGEFGHPVEWEVPGKVGVLFFQSEKLAKDYVMTAAMRAALEAARSTIG